MMVVIYGCMMTGRVSRSLDRVAGNARATGKKVPDTFIPGTLEPTAERFLTPLFFLAGVLHHCNASGVFYLFRRKCWGQPSMLMVNNKKIGWED
jgi:hypothetical protein